MSYARVDGVSLASQCWGAGPATIVAIPPFGTRGRTRFSRSRSLASEQGPRAPAPGPCVAPHPPT